MPQKNNIKRYGTKNAPEKSNKKKRKYFSIHTTYKGTSEDAIV